MFRAIWTFSIFPFFFWIILRSAVFFWVLPQLFLRAYQLLDSATNSRFLAFKVLKLIGILSLFHCFFSVSGLQLFLPSYQLLNSAVFWRRVSLQPAAALSVFPALVSGQFGANFTRIHLYTYTCILFGANFTVVNLSAPCSHFSPLSLFALPCAVWGRGESVQSNLKVVRAAAWANLY